MLVKIRKPIKGYGYFGGETVSLPDETAAKLVSEGAAILVQDTEGDVNKLPDDLPARELLFKNGFETTDQILSAAGTLTDIEGIGEKTVKKIIAYCNDQAD